MCRLQQVKSNWEEKLKDASEGLKTLKEVMKDHAGVQRMEETVVKEGVLEKTWKVKTKVKSDDGLTIDVSSLTGDQASRLLGNETCGRPYVSIIEAALGACGHDLNERTQGSFESEFCLQCNIAAIFFQYATIVLPVLKAKTKEELEAVSVARDNTGKKTGSVPWGDLTERMSAKKTELRNALILQFDPSLIDEVNNLPPVSVQRPKTGIDYYDEAVKRWGRLLVHTFTGGGSRYVISDYCKI